jgi:hypothetical protein
MGATAANQQAQAAKDAMGVWGPIWQQNQDNFNPYIKAGQGVLPTLQDLVQRGPNQLRPQDIASDPGYQFQLQEGLKALERSAAAKGSLSSGGTLKGLTDYAGGLASTQYQNAWNRNMQAYQLKQQGLSGLAGLGLGAAGTLGQFGNDYGTAMSNLYGAKGNAQAAGTTAIGNGAAGAVRSLGNIATLGAGGGLGALGGMFGGGGGGASTGYVGGMGGIPTQGPSFNLPPLTLGGMG